MFNGWLREVSVRHTDNYTQEIWFGVYICVCAHVVVCGVGGPWLWDIQLSYMINFHH